MVAIFPRSNFETALILILIPAIPIFGLLVWMHVWFGYLYSESEHCEAICELPPSNPTFFIPMEEEEKETWSSFMRKREVNPAMLQEYNEVEDKDLKKPLLNPSMAALIEFTNSKFDQAFRCAVPLISISWALTTDKCIHPEEKMQYLRIRLGSNFWNKGGILQTIQRIVYHKSVGANPIAIKFFKPNNINYRPFMIPSSEVKNPILPQMLFYLHVYHELHEANVTLYSLNKCRKGGNNVTLCGKQENVLCENEENNPLVDTGFLLGLHVVSDCKKNIVYFFDIFLINNWIQNIIGA